MLVSFFKSHSDLKSKCSIVKFVDRIWIESNGDMNCIRTFIVHVEDGDPLQDIRMLIPFRNTPKLKDISHTCLDQNYLYNNTNFSTGGYKIVTTNPEVTCGRVSYDSFEATVHTDNIIKSFARQCKNYEIIEINFRNNPIMKDEYRLFRISFSVTSVLDKIQSRVFSLRLDYFLISNSEEFKMMEIEKLAIPSLKIYDPLSKKGGFDVFIHFSSDKMVNLSLNACTFTTVKHLFDGSISDTVFHKLIWRARLLFPDEKVKLLEAGKTNFSVEGLIGDPNELAEIRSDVGVVKSEMTTVKSEVTTVKSEVTTVKSDLNKVVKGLDNSRKIAISGVIIAFISLIISCFKMLMKP